MGTKLNEVKHQHYLVFKNEKPIKYSFGIYERISSSVLLKKILFVIRLLISEY